MTQFISNLKKFNNSVNRSLLYKNNESLSKEVEYQLISNWQKNKDEKSLNKLLAAYQKLVNSILRKYLSYGISLAGLVQLIFVYFFTKKYFSPKLDLRLKITKKIKIFFNKFLPGIFSSGVTQINILVGTIIASFQASAVSYLYYADRIYQINLAIAGIAIGTVILPNLSKYIKR